MVRDTAAISANVVVGTADPDPETTVEALIRAYNRLPLDSDLTAGDLVQWDGTGLVKVDLSAASTGDLLVVQADGTVAPAPAAPAAASHAHTESDVTDLDHLTLGQVRDDFGNNVIQAVSPLSDDYDGGTGTVTLSIDTSGLAEADHDHERAPKGVSTTTYTLVVSDDNSFLRATNASGCEITVPPNSSEAFEQGDAVPVSAVGGDVTFAEGSGVTVNNVSATVPQGSNGTLFYLGSDEWDLWAPTVDIDPIGMTVVSGTLDVTGDPFTMTLPRAYTLTEIPHASVSSGCTTGTLTIDINEDGTSILSTKLTIDAGETKSNTAATPAVLSDTTLAQFSEITIDRDDVGDGTAEDLVVWLVGYWL